MYQAQCAEQRPQQDVCSEVDVGRHAAVTVPLPAAVYAVHEDRQSMAAGVILIVAGLFSVVITGVGVGVYNIFSWLAHGIWFGVVFIIAGAFGVLASFKNRCLIVTFLTLAVVSSALAIVMFLLSIVSILFGFFSDFMNEFSALLDKSAEDIIPEDGVPKVDIPEGQKDEENNDDDDGGGGGDMMQTGKMADYLAIVAAIAAAAAVWGAVLSSRIVCCRRQMTGIPIPVHGLYQLPVVGINKQLAAQQCRSDLATDAATSCDCLDASEPVSATLGRDDSTSQQPPPPLPRSPKCRQASKSHGICR